MVRKGSSVRVRQRASRRRGGGVPPSGARAAVKHRCQECMVDGGAEDRQPAQCGTALTASLQTYSIDPRRATGAYGPSPRPPVGRRRRRLPRPGHRSIRRPTNNAGDEALALRSRGRNGVWPSCLPPTPPSTTLIGFDRGTARRRVDEVGPDASAGARSPAAASPRARDNGAVQLRDQGGGVMSHR
jgi:hypothetical protein